MMGPVGAFRRSCIGITALGIVAGWALPGVAAGPLVEKALAGPLREVEEIVFCTRTRYDDGHWYANIGYYCDDERHKAYAGNGQPDDGKLCKLHLRRSEMTVLLDAKGGGVRDPQVHYDGRKILFSYRPAGTDFYHLYEINADGSGLRQLTSGEFDDYEPTYLPDGGIAFVSTRCKRWVNCWMTQVGTIYRCDADGRDIRSISANTEHDNTPWVLPDGRILYTRWEYVDRSQVDFHGLWTMNPDGTGATVYFGNQNPRTVMIDAKPVPGTQRIVASFSPGHGANEHAGIATILSESAGPDDLKAPRPLHAGRYTRDPYALSETCVLAARDKQIVLMDGRGGVETVYTYGGPGAVHEPRPLMPRPRERVTRRGQSHFRADAARRSTKIGTVPQATGRFVLADVYRGRRMAGVQRGEIKKLLVLESLPKPVNFSGGPDLTTWLGTFTLERVLGTVPVEADGSANFEVPANQQVFFVALDGRDLSVKRMQSWTSVMPGEVRGCVGCHESRTEAPASRTQGVLLAMRRPPNRIEPLAGLPDVLDFGRDIQPVLDRRCVECHNYAKREGRVILAGDLGPHWSHGYFSLLAHRLVADGRNGLGNEPPRTVGSSASRLLRMLDGSHYGARATPEEWRTLWLWIESGAPYAGSYAALRNKEQQDRAFGAAAAVFETSREVLRNRCDRCHGSNSDSRARPLPQRQDDQWRQELRRLAGRVTAPHERIVLENDPVACFSSNILLNFSRPELSPLVLGPLAKSAGGYESCGAIFRDQSDPDYQRILAAIRKGKERIAVEPRFGTPGFQPNRQYLRELRKYGVLPASPRPGGPPLDVFRLDQLYWQSLQP